MNRRTMMAGLAKTTAGIVAAGAWIKVADGPRPLPEPTPGKLPHWRGFNLLELFMAD